jgi:hypothetical protein
MYILTGYFTSDNEPGKIENATHNTLERKSGHGGDEYPAFPPDVLLVAFSIPPGSFIITRKIPLYQKSKKLGKCIISKNTEKICLCVPRVTHFLPSSLGEP